MVRFASLVPCAVLAMSCRAAPAERSLGSSARPAQEVPRAKEAIVPRDRVSGAVFAVPKGSQGALVLPVEKEFHAPYDDDEPPPRSSAPTSRASRSAGEPGA